MIDGKPQLKHTPAAKKWHKTIKNLKCVKMLGYQISKKAGKQDKDDNINCSVDNPTLHISIKSGKICRAGLYTCTEQFYIILPCFPAFC